MMIVLGGGGRRRRGGVPFPSIKLVKKCKSLHFYGSIKVVFVWLNRREGVCSFIGGPLVRPSTGLYKVPGCYDRIRKVRTFVCVISLIMSEIIQSGCMLQWSSSFFTHSNLFSSHIYSDSRCDTHSFETFWRCRPEQHWDFHNPKFAGQQPCRYHTAVHLVRNIILPFLLSLLG